MMANANEESSRARNPNDNLTYKSCFIYAEVNKVTTINVTK